MSTQSRETKTWAAEVAARLRLVLASCGEAEAGVRASHLTEEIDRALRPVPKGERTRYLEALAERFPAWQEGGIGQPSAPPAGGAAAAAVVGDVERIAAAIDALSPEEKNALTGRLADLGLAPGAGAAPETVELPVHVAKVLGLGQSRQVKCDRAWELLHLLVEAFAGLENHLWTTWRHIAPWSNVRQDSGGLGDFRLAAARLLSGAEDVTAPDVGRIVELRRRLISGVLGALGEGPRKFAADYLQKIAPEAVEDAARAEKSSFLISLEVKCWKKYVELSRDYSSEAAIESGIREQIARSAERLMATDRTRSRGAAEAEV